MRIVAQKILKRLKSRGYRAFIVGGGVRDSLIGIEPKDYDIVTDATPDEIKKVFPGSNLVGEHFGVVIVKVDNVSVEVATLRKDLEYKDGRRPEGVKYVRTPEEDASRRDFTINAIYAEDVNCNQLHDFFNGILDLMNKTLRTVGNPEDRFRQDYLRMLRAVRFSSKYGFKIEDRTMEAIRKLAPKIQEISKERITEEFKKMVMFNE